MAKEIIKKIKTSITAIREHISEIETIIQDSEITAEDGNYLADALAQTSLDMEGSLKLL